mmetsp:Transcript_116024/g.248038  ORF Transcript_116024/g.248038 Transcript_116024/m.248038 type:complete len:415 (-) Transcript_116024:166-1410(-)|eukprot:CAMPEP_0180625080 /NCGR_PEP_ID=MMETSP1037_2-20121125/37126_1 /TAXON_ID=632150 /ORGANISM="Azadinium spinosum, Strain 3D9" /LENGTH=414 /DNA_ID=CAMNT_0022645569 /DNA_START=129 /DNA_END=1373 /DNA_ORIENTATION=-
MAALVQSRRASKEVYGSGSAPKGSRDALSSEGPPSEPHSDLQGLANIFGGHPILSSMLVALPLGFASFHLEMEAQYVFMFNFIAIIPLAWLIGKATEDVSAKVGETAGGLLNATFGNVVEMLLCIAGIKNNEIAVVQCTLLGSILSNLLLVLGCSFLAGGLFHAVQEYNQAGASTQCSLLMMSVFAIGLPTIYTNVLKSEAEFDHMVQVSRWSSICLLSVYCAFLVFQLKTHADLFQDEDDNGEEEEEEPDLSAPTAAVLLAIATVVTSFATDYLIDALKGTVTKWNVSKEFVGIILLPIIGNAAEHYTAITVAMRNKMDLSLGVAVGSSCQMALLVTPFTVLVGWWYGTNMTLNFHLFQLAVLLFAVFLVTTILNNGRSNWFEGHLLLVTYLTVALIYFFEGAEEDASLATLS